jgi:hypothetical protein
MEKGWTSRKTEESLLRHMPKHIDTPLWLEWDPREVYYHVSISWFLNFSVSPFSDIYVTCGH